jgi:hypothetical protein
MQRTSQQNRSYWKGCELLAQALNDAGLEKKAALELLLKEGMDIPWTKNAIHEDLFKPIIRAMYGKVSTTQLGRIQISEAWDVLNRATGEKLGVTVPFPSEEGE